MNVAVKLVDFEASDLEEGSIVFPLTTDWDRERAIQITREVLTNIVKGMFKIPPGSVTLSDGKVAMAALSGENLERELQARRALFQTQLDSWPQVRAALVVGDDVDLVSIVGTLDDPLLLVRDRRLDRPIVAKYH